MIRYRPASSAPGRNRPSLEPREGELVMDGEVDGDPETATVRVGVVSAMAGRPQ